MTATVEMTASVELTVREEVESLHRFFVGWFSGTIAKTEFEVGFLSRFDPGFTLISPSGTVLDLDELVSSLRAGYAAKSDFRIAIRNVQVRNVSANHTLATYEEWQLSGGALRPEPTARITTALLTRTVPFKWIHVHETWLSETAVIDRSDEVLWD